MSSRQTDRSLQGSCSCGRNHLSIVLPGDAVSVGQQAQVFFDDSRPSHLPTPLLRVPLTWVSSSTIALFPDETHTTIRRTFTPASRPHVQHIFCGYCGTQISRWSEQPRSEADFLNIALATLGSRGLDLLEELDLLPTGESGTEGGDEEENYHQQQQQQQQQQQRQGQTTEVAKTTTTQTRQGRVGGVDWYEELIQGSRLGRTLQTRRGLATTADRSTSVQWEVSEWSEGSDDAGPKRKAGEIEDDDVGMSV